jgi:hypothetical protein
MVSKKEIKNFKKYLKGLSVDMDKIAEMENNEALSVVGGLFSDIRLKNPRFVFPSLYLKSTEETAKMLLDLDFAGFHFVVSLKISQIISESYELGKTDLWADLDCYLTDLIYAFEDMVIEDKPLMTPDKCVDIVRAMIASRVYISLGATALRLIISFNEVFIFSSDPMMTADDPECIMLFGVAARESVADELGVYSMLKQWVNSYIEASLPSWMEDTVDEVDFEKKADAFMSEAVMIYNLSKTVDSLEENAVEDPRSPDSQNRLARWGFLRPSDMKEVAPDEEGLEIVEDALKGYFSYLDIFRVMSVGYNIGRVTDSQWKAVRTTFSRFREHCGGV